MLGKLLKSLRAARTSPGARSGGAGSTGAGETAGASPAETTSPGAGAAARNEAGLAAWQRGHLAAAEREFRAALAADPGFAPAYGNLGMVVWEQRRLDEGLALLRKGVEIDPEHIGVRLNLAMALVVGNLHAQAIHHYAEVLRRQPAHPVATANVLKPLLDTCRWDDAERIAATLVDRWRAAKTPEVLDAMTPFTSLLVDVPQAMRRDLAQRYAERVGARATALRPVVRAPRPPGARLRIGYASADFHEHATMHLMAGLFEAHDRDRFEIHAYSWGIDDGSACRARVRAAIEHFHDVRALPHEAIAQRIADDGIDVLVDLKGYTGESRPEVLALRPAPVQVNWLGYPGTMAAPFIDWIIADTALIPSGDEAGYGERVLRLPASYQPNDRAQAIAERTPSRAECGLPDAGFVFASFNTHCKIERATFAAWMRILAAVPGSVLWLLGGHGEKVLRAAAAAAGVDPARLVFARKLPKSEHLARHRRADLFLDTRTYNAHTTASDALWAGLPLLAWPGDAFAGRVAASLLHAVDLPEMVMPDGAAYERTAIALAQDPARLAALRAQLAANRLTTPLFDTARFVRDLEAAFPAIMRTR
jgi:predicted O-linked N-acetylglucosamine transferase (SPINDLY family)